jgi:transcriptional regulator with XRE-family HTH domain
MGEQIDAVVSAQQPHDDYRREFGELLTRLRTARGWSQGKLAAQAAIDPSSVSRFEAGSRTPERETVIRLAEALVLPIIDRDRLLAAAGFRSAALDDPLISELANLLADPALPESAQLELRAALRIAVSYGRQARGYSER